MSIRRCLQVAVRAGEITPAEAASIEHIYAGLEQRFRLEGGVDAGVRAKAETAARLAAEAAERKRAALLQATVAKRILAEDIPAFRTNSGEQDAGDAILALMDHYGWAPFASVEGRRRASLGLVQARLDALDAAFAPDAVGRTRNAVLLDDLGTALAGGKPKDPRAAAMAEAFRAAAEDLRVRANRAGASIGKIDNWFPAPPYDRVRMQRLGREGWRALIRAEADFGRMRHAQTGGPIIDSEIDAIADGIWADIVTDGWVSRDPLVPYGRGTPGAQRSQHRFLHWRDYAAWQRVNDAVGSGDLYTAIVRHYDGMTRDIAAMEIFGPDPDAMVRMLGQLVTREGARRAAGEAGAMTPAGPAAAIAEAKKRVDTADRVWRHMRRQTIPKGERLAAAGAMSRDVVTATTLGGAMLSAIGTDPVYSMLGRFYAGLPALGALYQSIVRWARGPGARREAAAIGVINESALASFTTNARYFGEYEGHRYTRWLPRAVLWTTGLLPFTQAGKDAGGMAMARQVALWSEEGRSFAQLPPNFRRLFERYGLTAADWAVIARAPAEEIGGARFIAGPQVAAIDERVALRLQEVMLMETEYWVPSGTQRGASALRGNAQAGTWIGEALRSPMMFMSFSMTFGFLQGARLAQIRAARGSGAMALYAGAVLLSTTLGGALSIWLKDIAAGRDPRPIGGQDGNVTNFGLAAFLQGGGVGILGDFLFGDLNRYGGGLAGTLTGPLAQRVDAFVNLTFGNLQQFAQGKETKFWEELRRFAATMIPGSTIWYTRLAWQRLIMDQLREVTDPNAARAFRDQVSRTRRELGTEFWWAPGTTAPQRAPAFDLLRP